MASSLTGNAAPQRDGNWGVGVYRVFITVLARLRFVAILAVIGFILVKWETLVAHYEKWTHRTESAAEGDPTTEFFCPMHPAVVRPTSKEKCPICFMPLAKRKKGAASGAALPPGIASRVQISPYRVVLAGVRTVSVDFQPLTKDISTVGTVEFDERGQRHVAARVKARIDKLFVNQTGQMVHRGDPLAELYSPDLVVTAQNLLDARQAGTAILEQLARDRLRLWGIDSDQIDGVIRSGKPITHLTVRSPIDGHVIKKYQTEGRYVEEGGPLYDFADLRTVWIQAQIYEDDMAFLPGSGHALADQDRLAVTATAPAFPGEEFAGTLSFIYPHVDQETRTLTVRFELRNEDNRLRPGLTATVRLRLPAERLNSTRLGKRLTFRAGRVLAIPEATVIDTGSQTVVYREETPGTYDGVLVELGPRMSGPDGVSYFPVLSGLAAGDIVVGAGSFLIDAETRLNPAAGSIYIGGATKTANATPVRPSTPEDEGAKISAAIARLSPEDRALAEAQQFCPILESNRLGSMGVPPKVLLDGKPVMLCCSGCENKAKREPTKTLAKVETLRRTGKTKPKAEAASPEEAEIRAALAKLSPADRALAAAQRYCPNTGERLGSMGVPPKLELNGRTLFICCEGCDAPVRREPAKAFRAIEELKAKSGIKP